MKRQPTTTKDAAAAYGAQGGAARTAAKAEAARRNGAKGGRPRKVQAAPSPLIAPAVLRGLRELAARTKTAGKDARAAIAWIGNLEAGQ